MKKKQLSKLNGTPVASELSVEVTTTEVTLVLISALWCRGCDIISRLENVIEADSSNRSPEGLMQP